MIDNPFKKTRSTQLQAQVQFGMPRKQAEDVALCSAGHAAYMWAFSEGAHFDPNYMPCFCGQHKGRRVAKGDENPRAIAWLYSDIKDKPPPAKCNRSNCDVHPKEATTDEQRDIAACIATHELYVEAFSSNPGFNPNDLPLFPTPVISPASLCVVRKCTVESGAQMTRVYRKDHPHEWDGNKPCKNCGMQIFMAGAKFPCEAIGLASKTKKPTVSASSVQGVE